MNKYLLVAKNTWEETLTYRLNLVMWRLRTNLSLLALYFLWFAIIPKDAIIFGYSQSLMLTYILGTAIMSAVVLSNRSYAIGDEINQGNLSNFLIRPINYFLYWFSKDIGDKAMNIAFFAVELSILFLILKPPFFMQTNLNLIGLSMVSIVFSVLMYFLINVLLGFIGFWSPETWAPRFIFWVLLGFLAGSYFPLDILPTTIFEFFKLLPFSYLIYFPLKIYLGQLTHFELIEGLVIEIAWIIVLYFVSKLVWEKGLKIYTAYGR